MMTNIINMLVLVRFVNMLKTAIKTTEVITPQIDIKQKYLRSQLLLSIIRIRL